MVALSGGVQRRVSANYAADGRSDARGNKALDVIQGRRFTTYDQTTSSMPIAFLRVLDGVPSQAHLERWEAPRTAARAFAPFA